MAMGKSPRTWLDEGHRFCGTTGVGVQSKIYSNLQLDTKCVVGNVACAVNPKFVRWKFSETNQFSTIAETCSRNYHINCSKAA